MPTVTLQPSNFNFDVGGFAGFFGGDEAVSAMETVHLYQARWWTGWFNSPGSYSVGRHYGRLANSRLWNGMFPGPNEEPTMYIGLDGKTGPQYVASQSGTFMKQTGHLAYLLMQRCKDQQAVTVEGRRTRPNKITIVETQDIRFKGADTGPSLTICARDGLHKHIAFFPIAASIVTCILCAWDDDWYCFSLILLGVIANGISCVVIGSASIVLQGVAPSENAPPGDGILMDGNHAIVVLGKEKNVVAITQGKFHLDYKPWVRQRIGREKRRRIVGDGVNIFRCLGKQDVENGQKVERDKDAETIDEYAAIGLCSLLLVLQFVTQLLLIPQGTLFGQIMFLASFAASWAYNLFLASMDKGYLQEELLIQALGLSDDCMKTYKLGTRTTAAVFACLALQPDCNYEGWEKRGFKPQEIIQQFIPNDTPVWTVWREQVLGQMKSHTPALGSLNLEACGDRVAALSADDKGLLKDLLSDACTAYQQHMVLQARRRGVSIPNSVKLETSARDSGVGGC